MTQVKLQLAVDVNFAAMRFPVWGFRKIDGVRAGHVTGGLTGRSLDPFKNSAVVEKFADAAYTGFDGEMTINGWLNNTQVPEGETLCSLTTGLMNTSKLKKGQTELPTNVVWNLFDYLESDVIGLPYHRRYAALEAALDHSCAPQHVHLLPYVVIHSVEQAQEFIDECLDLDFEGAIFRDPQAMHKSGRATEKLNDFWRHKPTSDKDAIVLSVEEALQNNNEAKTNTLGRTERSAHQENKVGNGMVGVLVCQDVETGATIRVGPGAMTHDDRTASFKDQTLIVGHPIKYRSLDTGVKDAPRQARFVSRRPKADLAAA